MGVGSEERLCFDRGFLGDMTRLLQGLHVAYMWFVNHSFDIKIIYDLSRITQHVKLSLPLLMWK